MRQVKKDIELDIVNSIKKGLNPSKIAIQLNLSLPNLSYYLSSLKSNGIIKKVGYGTWEVIPSGEVKINDYHTNSKVKEIRGHAFIWKVKPRNSFNWKEILESKKIPYESKGLQKTPRIIINGKKIWLGQTNIIIYDRNSHFAINSIESKKLGVWELQESLIAIEKALDIDLTGVKFTSRREHYSLIKNCLAIQCNKEGKSIYIKNEKGYWFSIDNSLDLHEAEALGKDSIIDSLGIQKYFNSHKATNFKVTPEFILDSINKVTQNQEMFAKNIETHMEVLKGIKEAIKELKDTIHEK